MVAFLASYFGRVIREIIISYPVDVRSFANECFGCVYSAHITRQLFEELTQLQSWRDAYEMEWSQLLLEQSAWSAHGRIEHVAISKLGMKVPDAQDIVIIK